MTMRLFPICFYVTCLMQLFQVPKWESFKFIVKCTHPHEYGSSEQVDLYCFQDCQEWSEKQLKWKSNFRSLFMCLGCVALWIAEKYPAHQLSCTDISQEGGHSSAHQAWAVMLELLVVASRLVSSGLRVPLPSALFREQAADPCRSARP